MYLFLNVQLVLIKNYCCVLTNLFNTFMLLQHNGDVSPKGRAYIFSCAAIFLYVFRFYEGIYL
jgi:hypothetical protein